MMRSSSKLVKSTSKLGRSSSKSKMVRSSSKMMARSSSKLVTQVRSIRNLGRTSVKFRVELRVERVEKIAGSKGSCVFVIEKPGATAGGSSSVATSGVSIDAGSCVADFTGVAPLVVEVTLFKAKPSDPAFQPKGLKMSLRSARADGSALGKMGFNVAEYASGGGNAVPFCATMNGGPVLKGKLSCTEIGNGDDDDDAAFDELTDECRGSDGGSASTSCAVTGLEDGVGNKAMKNKFKMRVSSPGMRGSKKRADAETSLAGGGSGNSPELERVTRHNGELRRQLESGGDEAKVADENAQLKSQIEELNAARKEPLPAEVVRQLKEAKMALAMMSLEKEEMLMTLRRHRGGETPRF